ncbi:Uncharacterized membrane protein [Clostridium cavendishii DSM 21758]|uniref:Uncharacterized membrane protein n=1 Tax=Clostridium cavendishii DSM 21758 TaxID=1121302 RepID=A0A1M6JAT1_9CLOT|nr:DUF6541 family protein [Clostridium cavendishii]SHJ43811.1 Uncharacterized membrane protein [Clostridium cavendishii DSM 21758]
MENSHEKKDNKKYKTIKLKISDITISVYSFILIALIGIMVLVFINKTGNFPWGSDTYGHLFKGNILSDSIKEGKYFVNYNEYWYNGVQPFRYWAPLPYYILAAINLVTNNIITTFNVYVFFVYIIGATGWLLFGKQTKRQFVGLTLAILWFFVPYNLRILFSEGNLPFALINSLIPYGLLFFYKSVKEGKISSYIFLGIVMHLMTISHAMLSAMFGISLFLLVIVDVVINKRIKKNIMALGSAFFGVMTSLYWLYPALKGGLLGQDKGAVENVMKAQTHPFSISLNPFCRFQNYEIYYYGLAFAIVIIIGVLFSLKRSRSYFLVALIILIGTNTVAVSFLKNLPLNQLFWMNRFTAISIGLIFVGIITWEKLRPSMIMFLILIMTVDSFASFYLVGNNAIKPISKTTEAEFASKIASQRVAVLDSSSMGSVPSYYISYNGQDGCKNQVFGWAWQGATTSKNIMELNTALENEYYEYMFDRALSLGADTLILKKSFIKDLNKCEKAYEAVGYKKVNEFEFSIILKYPVNHKFGTITQYDGLAIGKYSNNLVYIFPSLKEGNSDYIDDYSLEELKKYKVIYISGAYYKDKDKANKLLLDLSNTTTNVVVDTTGLESNDLLDINVQPITVKNNYSNMYYKKEKIELDDFPSELKDWKTSYGTSLESCGAYGELGNRGIEYIGKLGKIKVISLNIPYYTFLTKDDKMIKILEDTLGIKSYSLPEKTVEPIDVEVKGNSINIKSEKLGVVVPIAAIDAFHIVNGDYSKENNLLKLSSKELELKVIYPYFKTGIVLSIINLIIFIVAILTIKITSKKSRSKSEDQNNSEFNGCKNMGEEQ